MVLRDLTSECQTHCHEGYSDCLVYVKVCDAYYKVKEIKMDHGIISWCVLETEPMSNEADCD